ncbi:MAG: hypothetical protein M1821_009956 [Bathelium mastoideum]|nr:MAG: hypothetical protein M1821_009956 [Bathelium mastoideum]KAI9690274.1 MAG: hypothetical protein M1822_009235 [Bathelium mastoideum]
MALKLERCKDADMRRTFEIVSDAFGHQHPYIEAVFPHHGSDKGRAAGAERLLTMKPRDPNAVFLKVVDTDSGQMIAQAKWNVYRNTVPPELTLDGDFWDSQDQKELANYLFAKYLEPRGKAIKQSGSNLL